MTLPKGTNVRQQAMILIAGLLTGGAIGVIGVILTVFGAMYTDYSYGISGIIMAIIGMVMIQIFAKKSKSLPRP